MPHGRLLIRITEPQQIRLSVLATNQLKSNGDALGAHAARDRQRWVAGQVERRRENCSTAGVGLSFSGPCLFSCEERDDWGGEERR